MSSRVQDIEEVVVEEESEEPPHPAITRAAIATNATAREPRLLMTPRFPEGCPRNQRSCVLGRHRSSPLPPLRSSRVRPGLSLRPRGTVSVNWSSSSRSGGSATATSRLNIGVTDPAQRDREGTETGQNRTLTDFCGPLLTFSGGKGRGAASPLLKPDPALQAEEQEMRPTRFELATFGLKDRRCLSPPRPAPWGHSWGQTVPNAAEQSRALQLGIRL